MDQTRKKKMVYKFVTRFHDDNLEDIDNTKTFFYQLASFPEPTYNKFHLRVFLINSKNEIIDVKTYWLSKKEKKHFCASKRCNEYKLYDVYNLGHVSHPTNYDLNTSKSNLLSYNDNYSGFASF